MIYLPLYPPQRRKGRKEVFEVTAVAQRVLFYVGAALVAKSSQSDRFVRG
jgi:hypothetical protein